MKRIGDTLAARKANGIDRVAFIYCGSPEVTRKDHIVIRMVTYRELNPLTDSQTIGIPVRGCPCRRQNLQYRHRRRQLRIVPDLTPSCLPTEVALRWLR